MSKCTEVCEDTFGSQPYSKIRLVRVYLAGQRDRAIEIPSTEIERHYPHLKALVDKIPPFDPKAAILLLLGRDILCVHKVSKHYNRLNNTPMLNNSTLAGLLLEMYAWEELRRLSVSAPQGNMGLKDLYTKQLRQFQAPSETSLCSTTRPWLGYCWKCMFGRNSED